ncbi:MULTISPECIES: PucR family transcriptional regulator [Paenibacillus]|nr:MULTISPECIES: helix-turn-helix domain-containing protein [Paenibacillus]
MGTAMVEKDLIVQTLEQVLGVSLGYRILDDQESEAVLQAVSEKQNRDADLDEAAVAPTNGVYDNNKENELWIPLHLQKPIPVITAPRDVLTPSEVGLMKLWLSSLQEDGQALKGKGAGKADEERQARQLGDWLMEQVREGALHAALPAELRQLRLKENMVPFLLTNESESSGVTGYKALQRLLKSYFDGEVLLIPLQQKEWMVLASQDLLAGGLADEKEDSAVEADQDLLSLFCMGLYELISTEWVGDFHIAAIPPVDARQGLPSVLHKLRETMAIGRVFRVKEHIHLSTGLHLERLIFSIPEAQRNRFLQEYAALHTELFEDSETLSTLESFFELDCNVSETAKHLYIHRNTLLYRLDKIKQETGLDVRSFSDAVLVKMTLLLYKVTKRK